MNWNRISNRTVGDVSDADAGNLRVGECAPIAISSSSATESATTTDWLVTVVAIFVALVSCGRAATAADRPPNIIFILSDDLGYGDLGCYGQQRIQTPHLDRMASQGMRFTHFYAGSTVCAPSRCALMTGLHCGHARIRGNGLAPLETADVTVAELLRDRGYETALVGKWGLGEAGTTGVPTRQGFDAFFGYLNQNHAHNYYPDFLWRNEQRVAIDGNIVANGVASERRRYSHDLFVDEALTLIARAREKPFFLYLAVTIPHANNEARELGMEVPGDAPYSDRDWPQAQKNHAAMITHLDQGVGRLMAQLKASGVDDNTIVFFSSDNGPHREGGADPEFFDSNGPLRGIKRDLYDGGIRVPLIARWPGHVSAGVTSALIAANWDLLPTLTELAGAETPDGLDGISLVPELLGPAVGREQGSHEYLYWEFHERGFVQAIRFGDHKAVRRNPPSQPEIYDLTKDPGEQFNLADARPELLAQAEEILSRARTASPHWPIKKPSTDDSR